MKIIVACCLLFWTAVAIGQGTMQAYEDEINAFRKEHKEELISGDRHPLAAEDLSYLDFYSADPAWKVNCRFKKIKKGKQIDIPTYSGITKPYRAYGRLIFRVKGKKHKLLLYQSLRHLTHPVYKEYLFLPFKDHTNGEETYGGGRYIDIRLSDLKTEPIVLDFNKSYNPWCAYSDGFNCPVPPIENHLSIPVNAGEKDFSKIK